MKNKACCWILGILAAFVVLSFIGLAILIVSISSFSGAEVAGVKDGSYLILQMSGPISEYSENPFRDILRRKRVTTMLDATKALDRAKNDSRVAGVVLCPQGLGGFAEIRELRDAVSRFKSSGKPVYAYLEVATDRDYYLASMADTVVMIPAKSGGMIMLGLGIAQTYMAKTFEKVGLKFHVLHCGDYKGAYENFGRESMSEPLRISLQTLIDDIFNTYVKEIPEQRKALSRETLEHELLHGEHYIISGPEAKQKGFVDLNCDWEELKARLAKDKKFDEIAVSKYLRATSKISTKKKEIAVLFAQGEINYTSSASDAFDRGDGIRSNDFIEELRDLRERDDVAAVVLRVNSPGGSALASDLILQEVKRLKEKKPVVVSMGNVAASGGYYISCAGSRIIAQPNTITGSIGVVSLIPTAEGLYKKVDAKVERVEKGKWAEYYKFDQTLTPAQEAVFMDMMNGIYEEFLDHVAAGRQLPLTEVQKVASGRVWTGSQALERKLVDELGGLDLAIQRARELSGVKEEAGIDYYPKRKDFIGSIIDAIGAETRVFFDNWTFTPEQREVRDALNYMRLFYREHNFVRAYAPVNVEELSE